MDELRELLYEINIRFNLTSKIQEEGYPFENICPKVNNGLHLPRVSSITAYNSEGLIYVYPNWAVADIKEMPERWVVEKDTEHPAWEDFCTFWIGNEDNPVIIEHIKGLLRTPENKFYNKEKASSYLTEQDFYDHQLITVEQWSKLNKHYRKD